MRRGFQVRQSRVFRNVSIPSRGKTLPPYACPGRTIRRRRIRAFTVYAILALRSLFQNHDNSLGRNWGKAHTAPTEVLGGRGRVGRTQEASCQRRRHIVDETVQTKETRRKESTLRREVACLRAKP